MAEIERLSPIEDTDSNPETSIYHRGVFYNLAESALRLVGIGVEPDAEVIYRREDVCAKDTEWKDLLKGRKMTIPSTFITDLLEGRIDATPLQQIQVSGNHEEGWLRRVQTRLNPKVINYTLHYDGFSDLSQNLAHNLTDIVYCHSEHGDYTDINFADRAIDLLGLKMNSSLTAYFSGSGLCMHVASLGVAIARANGVQAEIVGHPHYYYTGEPVGRHHYGIKLQSDTGESQLVIPRGVQSWKVIKNGNFKKVPDYIPNVVSD
jgi:hypothetical protein